MRVFSLAVAAIIGIQSAMADPVMPPVRVRFNSAVLEDLFHSGDQRMFGAFGDLLMQPILEADKEAERAKAEQEESQKVASPGNKKDEKKKEPTQDDASALVHGMKMKLQPPAGIEEGDYDFDMSLNDPAKGFLGFQATDLLAVGSGQIQGVEGTFTFSAPVSKVRVSVDMVPEESKDILKFNPVAKMPKTRPFEADVGEVTFTNFPADHPQGAYIKGLIANKIKKCIVDTHDEIWDGDLKKIANLPVESFIPLLFAKHLGSFAHEYEVTPKALTFGFDPETLTASKRPFAQPLRKKPLLKAIKSEFSEPGEKDVNRLLSLIVDENAFNSFILDFVLVDKSFSLRDFMGMNAQMRNYVQAMNTSKIGIMMPAILEEFGKDRKIDVMFTTSHSLISQKLKDARVSGFQMDRNGNFRFAVNVGLEIAVEKEMQPGHFEQARSLYMSLQAKGKVAVKEHESKNKNLRRLTLSPKAVEVGLLKIYKPDGEEMTVEQMVMTSGINVQLEQVLKFIKPQEMPMRNPPSPRELSCLGIKLADLNVLFRKGYCEISVDYKKVKTPEDPAICEKFMDAMKKGPKNVMDKASETLGGKNISDFLQGKKKAAQQAGEDNKTIEDRKAEKKEQEKKETIQIEDL